MDFKGYFYIMSRQTGMVLDVRGSNHSDNAPIIIWQLKSEEKEERKRLNQLWKYNSETGELESRMNGHRLDVAGGYAHSGAEIVNNPANYSPSQKWYFKPDGTIESGLGDMWVLDVKGGHTEPRTSVILHQRQEGGPSISQQWDVVPYVPMFGEFFYIRSNLNNCYLQIMCGSEDKTIPSLYIVDKADGSPDQLWKYDKETRAIHTGNANDYALDVPSEEGNPFPSIVTKPPKRSARQAWTFEKDGSIVSGLSGLGKKMVLNIRGSGGALSPVILYDWNSGENQKWYISAK
ncbi:uncharacterized protein LOC118404384 [Branchiostoma floridae]|uniref:Uncharacterized protein LOC118404384 n=1 Tax=Branchiostoma floridae TaxID=7739 RepID=A0A9J7KHT9_BRAFL|nr:uncharacterized protein LOC118404384 [Branchiostoma floridae]